MSDANGDGDPDDELPSPHTSLKVEPEEKKRWMMAVHEGEYRSLSHLIYTAVQHELSDDYQHVRFGEANQEEEEETTVDLSPVQDTLDTMEERLSNLEADMEAAMDGGQREPLEPGSQEMTRIASKVQGTLPLVESEEELRDLEVGLELPVHEKAKITGFVEDLAEALDEDRMDVRDAALYLSNRFDEVDSIVQDGRRRFYELDQ